VVDDDSMGYYLMFNIPIIIYFLLFVFTFFKYEKGYLASQAPEPVTNAAIGGDNETPAEPLNPVVKAASAVKKINAQQYHKLYMNMKIQRFYFLFYIIMIIPNFFTLSDTGLEWYSVFTCLHPIVIISILLWSISINA
jgi:hypothetical protein